LDFSTYVSVDCDVQVFAISTEEEIIADVLQPDTHEYDDESGKIALLPLMLGKLFDHHSVTLKTVKG